jgi:hypothetical protein
MTASRLNEAVLSQQHQMQLAAAAAASSGVSTAPLLSSAVLSNSKPAPLPPVGGFGAGAVLVWSAPAFSPTKHAALNLGLSPEERALATQPTEKAREFERMFAERDAAQKALDAAEAADREAREREARQRRRAAQQKQQKRAARSAAAAAAATAEMNAAGVRLPKLAASSSSPALLAFGSVPKRKPRF